MFFLPTHRLGNTVDLVFSNKAMIDQLDVFDPLISDHRIVIIKLNILCFAVPENHELKIYQYSKVDLQKAESIFEPYEKEIKECIDNNQNINTIYSVLLQGLSTIREKCVPSRVPKFLNQPGRFTNKIENALKKQKNCIKLLSNTSQSITPIDTN